MNTVEGYAAMLHAIAHIEFNAINLALDAAYRFRNIKEREKFHNGEATLLHKVFQAHHRRDRQSPCQSLRLHRRRIGFHYQLRHQIPYG